jgi:hypothetical protein
MPTAIPPHEVPSGPLGVRWHSVELPDFRAGKLAVFPVELENAGSAPWRSRPGVGVHLAYHWLDLFGNPIVWAGAFIKLPDLVPAGERLVLPVSARPPTAPGRYRLALDLVDEGRAWFSELGNHRLEFDVDVRTGLTKRALSVEVAEGPAELVAATQTALEAQEEPLAAEAEATAYLAAGCRPAPDWSRRVLDAHEEGFAAVAGSVEVERAGLFRRGAAELAPWRPGFGRAPGWTLPLVCPSLVAEVLEGAAWTDPVAGLPALDTAQLVEPWLCDGRIRVVVAATALPRAGRRSA